MYDEPLSTNQDVITEAFRLAPNGIGFWYKEWITETFLKVVRFTEDDLVALSKASDQFHVVTLINRGHSHVFSEHLETTFFPPESEINDEFQYRLFKWEDMEWAIYSVPIAKANTCYLTASAIGCRLANGVPHILGMAEGGRGVGNSRQSIGSRLPGGFAGLSESVFPLDNERTFTLEPDHGTRGPVIGAIGIIDPPPKLPPREPDLLDIIMAKRKKKR